MKRPRTRSPRSAIGSPLALLRLATMPTPEELAARSHRDTPHGPGITQEEFAARSGLGVRTVQYYEAGERKAPSLPTLTRMATGLCCAVGDVVACFTSASTAPRGSTGNTHHRAG